MTQLSTSVGESEVVLRDGSTVHLRDALPADRKELRRFLESLSLEARRLRFFTAAPDLALAARWAAGASERSAVSVVATVGNPARIVGHAGFEPIDEGAAEIAFEVAESLRGRGLATLLMAQLAARAREQGIETFVAEVLPDNRRMLEVFRESGFPMQVRRAPDELRIELTTALTREALERYEDRERLAAAAAMRHFLEPASIAVVGASRKPGSVGGQTLRNLLTCGFEGPVYAVNHRARRVQGLAAHRSVADLPDVPELVVVATPADDVLSVASDCALKGVRALLVLSGGFAEMGAEGERRQDTLVATCRAAGMRLVGPNCLGVIGGAGRVNATFSPHAPPPGRVGLLSQSGGVGLALMEQAAALGLGLSSFVSIGNRPDVSANDVLEYWQDDPSTDIVAALPRVVWQPAELRAHSATVVRRQARARRHAGRSSVGARAAASHTGAAIAGSGAGVDALLAHAGVVRVETLRELFDTAALRSAQPLPRGPGRRGHQRRAAGDPLRRRLRGRRTRRAGAVEEAATEARARVAAACSDEQSRGHAGCGRTRRVRAAVTALVARARWMPSSRSSCRPWRRLSTRSTTRSPNAALRPTCRSCWSPSALRSPRAGSRGRRGSRIRRTRPARWLGSCATSSGAMSRAGSFRR